jgi:Carboxypeptidase regulatory-like domain
MPNLRAIFPQLLAAAGNRRLGITLLSAAALYAQSVTTGDIAGTVKDPSGAIVPGATVTLVSPATGENRTQTVSSSGEYRFSTLRPGSYRVTASSPGLSSDTGIVSVGVGQVVTDDITVNVGSSKEVVQVTEQVPLLQSENANLTTTFDTQQLENLPAPGNDMTSYAFSTPGVTVSTGGGYGNFSVFGLPGVSNLYTVNGNDNMDPYLNLNNSGASNLTLGANEIAEAAVVVNGYTGQYGRQAGANVNYVTKSGTNAFHGNAAWYYNDRILNANDWFNNATGTQRPFAVSNEWAASLGGPIKKNKLFFFVDDEGLRYVLPGGGPVYVPTKSFSDYVTASAGSSAVAPFYQNIFKLYQGASGYGRATPNTDLGDGGCGDFAGTAGFGPDNPCSATFRSTVNNLNTEWLMAARVDYNVTGNDRVYFRFNTDHGVQATGTDPINPVFNANSVQPSYGGQFGYTKTIGASMVNQLLLSATYYSAIFGPPNLSAALQAFPTTLEFVDGAPFNNLGGTDNNYPQGRKVRQWQLVDDYSISKGRHTIKFGANVRKNFIATYAYGANTSGAYVFNSMTDFVNGSLSTAGGSTYSQAFARIGAENLTMYSAGFYVQDEWRVRPNFTLTLALRMDRNSNIQCAVGCFNEFKNQPFGQLAHDVTTPYNGSIVTGLKKAFPSVEPVVPAPRVGFAWNVAKNTVVRGGFGIFSDLYQGLIADRLITNSPAVTSFTATSGLVGTAGVAGSAPALLAASNAAFQNGFASGATAADLQDSVPGFSKPTFNTVGNEQYNPKYYEWNFELQQSFTNNYLLSVNYVGNHGYQEINQTLFANQYSPTGFVGLPTTAPDARFGQIRELSNTGFSNYDGLVTSFRWRATSNFTGSFSYTWSHSLDTCSNSCLEPFNALTAVSLRYQVSPQGQRALNYGNSDYDVRHSLNANYVYTLPTSYFHNRLLKGVLGGWTAAGTLYYHTGYPFSIVNSGVRAAQNVRNASPGIATQTFLADVLSPLTASSSSCTTPNTPCFTDVSFASKTDQRDFGNLARNSFRGPGYFDTDLNLNKAFAIRERYKLVIGANFFNIFNHPNFDLPVNNIAASGTFGMIQNTVSAPTSAYGSFQGSAVSGRVIQSQVKFTF